MVFEERVRGGKEKYRILSYECGTLSCWGVIGSGLVLSLVGLGVPGFEGLDGLVGEHLLLGDEAVGFGEGELLVDERVVEIDARGIGFGVAVENFRNVSPVYCAEAHGAWFARRVYHGAGEVERTLVARGVADGVDLGMGGGVVVSGNTIYATANDLTVFHHNCAKGTSAVCDVGRCHGDGFAHEFFFGHGCLGLWGWLLYQFLGVDIGKPLFHLAVGLLSNLGRNVGGHLDVTGDESRKVVGIARNRDEVGDQIDRQDEVS